METKSVLDTISKERASKLLAQMSLEEKVGQMNQTNGLSPDALSQIELGQSGTCLHALGDRCIELQDAAKRSRLKIPVLMCVDAIHGHSLWKNATVFPTMLNMSQTWNTDLIEEFARVSAREIRATGAHLTFSPQLDLCNDIRWGRLGETLGEDPYLIGELGAAIIRGYQGNNLAQPEQVAACAKHFAGYGYSEGGRDASDTDLSKRVLRQTHLKPFFRALSEGVASIMAAYQALDGVPCSQNKWLQKTILRGECAFDGMLITDWDNIGRSVYQNFTSETIGDACVRAIEAGTDVAMGTAGFFTSVVEAVKSGRLPEQVIDQAVLRILTLKFSLGLFDDEKLCYPDMELVQTMVGCKEHKKVALETARQSVVLLENNGLLPLKSVPKKIAVLGPNADDLFAQLGGWSFGAPQQEFADPVHDKKNVITVLDGLKEKFSSSEIRYERACLAFDKGSLVPNWCKNLFPAAYFEYPQNGLKRAKELCDWADIIFLVLGDSQILSGEQCDRVDALLQGEQQELASLALQSGKASVGVLISSKPLILNGLPEKLDALVWAGCPGMEGGRAVAEILTGEVNPSGKLTWSWPKHVGQQPVQYNHRLGWHGDRYVEMDTSAQYPFGYGLSYTHFELSELKILTPVIAQSESIKAEIEILNAGKVQGVAIVQCFVADLVSSVTTPVMELKSWKRVTLKAGEQQKISFEIPFEALSLINEDEKCVVETGSFEMLVGLSSKKEDLLKASFVYKNANK